MKYLFEAIDARLNGAATTAPGGVDQAAAYDPSLQHQRYSAAQLKELLAEAADSVHDEKASAHEFTETLERIVQQLKSETDHSLAFLQKVKKSEAPDYHLVIKNPMDLGTLQKRVKSGMYRSKKAFADDLDLIWSNCLAYNTHPSHPLRRSAELMREKSNQLLEFVTDPQSQARQSSLAASTLLPSGPRTFAFTRHTTPVSAQATTTSAAEDAAGSGGGGAQTPAAAMGEPMQLDSDAEEDTHKRALLAHARQTAAAAAAASNNSSNAGAADANTPASAAQHLLGRRGTGSAAPASPASSGISGLANGAAATAAAGTPAAVEDQGSASPSTSATPAAAAAVGQSAAPPGALAPVSALTRRLPFEEQPALVRTPGAMAAFLALDAHLCALEHAPRRPSEAAGVANGTGRTGLAGASASTREDIARRTLELRPALAAIGSSPAVDGHDDESPAAAQGQTLNGDERSPVSRLAAPGAYLDTSAGTDELWWRAVGAGSALPLAAPISEASVHEMFDTPEPALAAGVPACPFVCSTSRSAQLEGSIARLRKAKASNKAAGKQRAATTTTTTTTTTHDGVIVAQMRHNVTTLRNVRRTHTRLIEGSSSKTSYHPMTMPSLSDLSDDDSSAAPRKRRRPGPPQNDRQAARQVESAVCDMLEHTGFEGSTSTALNTISSAASNYLSNIARTVQLYADRYGSELTLEQVLLRTLAENGVAGPRELALHVKNDVGLYGARLDAIDARLRAKRSEQLDAAESGATDDVPGEHSLEARDGEGYLTGEHLAELGIDLLELSQEGIDWTDLHPPLHLFRGEPRDPDAPVNPRVVEARPTYPPPPEHVALTPAAIDSQIGLLQPFLQLRAKSDYGLTEDWSLSTRSRNMRAKVPPSGRIPLKMQKRSGDGAFGTSKKQRKKQQAAEES